jgi:hypothetical protein
MIIVAPRIRTARGNLRSLRHAWRARLRHRRHPRAEALRLRRAWVLRGRSLVTGVGGIISHYARAAATQKDRYQDSVAPSNISGRAEGLSRRAWRNHIPSTAVFLGYA